MRVWQVQEAKNKFSELLRESKTRGPQVITKHGHREAVVLSGEEYDRLTGRKSVPHKEGETDYSKMNFREFLLAIPKCEDLEDDEDLFPRSDLRLRDIEF